jgi:methionyl-tRNA formyltransferase
METGSLEFREQSAVGICYARKIKKGEAEIDWTQSGEAVRNQIHGLSPGPGAFSSVLVRDRNENIKFLRAEVAPGTGAPGTLLSEDMCIGCGSGAVRVLEGQRAGKAMMSGRELLRGAKLAPGAVFTFSRVPLSVPR